MISAAMQALAREVLADWGLQGASMAPVHTGHINITFIVEKAGRRAVLQRLNPIFVAEVHHDIDAMAQHLAAAGLDTPQLIRTRVGGLWTRDRAEGVWRLQTYMPGFVVDRPMGPSMCAAAGTLLGRFHRALAHVEHTFVAPRGGVHDTARHLAGLQAALGEGGRHPAYAQVAPMADVALAAADALTRIEGIGARIVHGDPKISNFVFAAPECASCLIDLDTLAHMPVPLELGDAFRSWCNPNGEGGGQSAFNLDAFAAGLRGYAHAMRDLLTPAELHLVPAGVHTVCLELTMRFLRDALEERYFGWDSMRFAAAWQHNVQRARSQWDLTCAFVSHRREVEAIVAQVSVPTPAASRPGRRV